MKPVLRFLWKYMYWIAASIFLWILVYSTVLSYRQMNYHIHRVNCENGLKYEGVRAHHNYGNGSTAIVLRDGREINTSYKCTIEEMTPEELLKIKERSK